MHVELAFDAGRHGREDDTSLALEALCSAVDKGLHGVWIRLVDHADKGGVDPAARFDAVETADDHGKLHVVVFVLVLDFAAVRCDLDAFDTLLDELGGDFGFVAAYIRCTKEKLPVQVGDVNGVHVDNVDVLEAGEGEVLENLAS